MEVNNSLFGSYYYDQVSVKNEEKLIKQFSIIFNNIGSSNYNDSLIVEMIQKGQGIADVLLKGQKPPEANFENALCLVWFIMACAYEEVGDTFTRGSVRVQSRRS